MPASLTISAGTLLAFLLVLARVGGALVFVPLPGLRGVLEPARAALALGFTMSLVSRWPTVNASVFTTGMLACHVASEAALGLAIGITVALVLEALVLAAQVLGMQAGYAYASTVDPNTEADSGILLVMAQLMAGMIFFAAGLDRQLLRLFAETLEKIPPGAYTPGIPAAETAIRLGAHLFTFGLRLAIPVVALLVMVDVSLALLGRLNAQLQLLSLAFPAKMLTALAVLAWVMPLFPRILMEFNGLAAAAARRVLGL
jgi:flagellar biosynthesis protein FliR